MLCRKECELSERLHCLCDNCSCFHCHLKFLSAPGTRKVVLCTNVCESSITIDDAVYVVNSGKMKQKEFDSDTSECGSICLVCVLLFFG
jgi:hypothetical protein